MLIQGSPTTEVRLPMKTILPPRPRAIISAPIFCVSAARPWRLVRMICSYSSGVYCSKGLRIFVPATLMRISAAGSAVASPERVTSSWRASAWAPPARSCSASAASRSMERPARMVRAPAWASPRAIARPMPRLAPATRAVRPCSSNIIALSPQVGEGRLDFGASRRRRRSQGQPRRSAIVTHDIHGVFQTRNAVLRRYQRGRERNPALPFECGLILARAMRFPDADAGIRRGIGEGENAGAGAHREVGSEYLSGAHGNVEARLHFANHLHNFRHIA